MFIDRFFGVDLTTKMKRILTVVVGGAVALMLAVPAANAASTSHLTIVSVLNDHIYNYDFLSQSPSSTNVDWAITMVFHDNAEVDKVKNIFWGNSGAIASPMNARFDDDGSYVWDSDSGTKSAVCGVDQYHMRVYADQPGGDRNYNAYWGYYVLGTTHIDHKECVPWEKWSGKGEQAEDFLLTIANAQGYSIQDDAYNFQNNEPPNNQGTHHWDNNAYASLVDVP